jgi:6-phosphogluconolactonase
VLIDDSRSSIASWPAETEVENRQPAVENYQPPIVNRDIRIFDDLGHLSWAAATRFEELARVKALENKIFAAALSGGSTPRQLYEILGSPAFAGRVRWPNVHLFQVDERCVPPDDPASNYRMIGRAMLESSPLPEGNFHRMAAERPDREQAARDYAGDLARILQPARGEFPRLDLVFLGMGPDGHTASLFPGSEALDEQTAWIVPNYVRALQAVRLTLTLPVLNAAAHVIFMVTGAEKAVTLREVLEGPPGRFPAQRVQAARGRVSWFVDKSAARLLSPAARG